MLTSGDREDIALGFDSLDIDVNGFLSLEDVHTLFLGLGYANRVDAYVSVDSLRKMAGRDALDLEEIFELFGKFKRFEKGEHRRSHWQSVFRTIVGHESNACSAAHIQELCRDYGMEDLDMDQAQRILLSIKDERRVNRLRPLNEHEKKQTLTEEDFLSVVNNRK